VKGNGGPKHGTDHLQNCTREYKEDGGGRVVNQNSAEQSELCGSECVRLRHPARDAYGKQRCTRNTPDKKRLNGSGF
jgi:hypothetical protein